MNYLFGKITHSLNHALISDKKIKSTTKLVILFMLLFAKNATTIPYNILFHIRAT